MTKIKELARTQAIEGSKDINYGALVNFLYTLDTQEIEAHYAYGDTEEDQN